MKWRWNCLPVPVIFTHLHPSSVSVSFPLYHTVTPSLITIFSYTIITHLPDRLCRFQMSKSRNSPQDHLIRKTERESETNELQLTFSTPSAPSVDARLQPSLLPNHVCCLLNYKLKGLFPGLCYCWLIAYHFKGVHFSQLGSNHFGRFNLV